MAQEYTPAPSASSALGMQQTSKRSDPADERINVRLILSQTEFYDESLRIDVVRALISPLIPDAFIQIVGVGSRAGIPRCKGHYLHTSFIREIVLLDELREEGAK